MDLRQIVTDGLKANCYDALRNEYGCGCGIGDGFMPCDEPSPDCEAAHRVQCPEGGCQHRVHCEAWSDFTVSQELVKAGKKTWPVGAGEPQPKDCYWAGRCDSTGDDHWPRPWAEGDDE